MGVLTLGKSFYLKLAVTNLKKNRNSYIPYILAGIGMVFTYVLFLLISGGEGIANLVGGATLQSMFIMGTVIISIFSVVFIFYANSFLMKRRKKEIALYGILGLEKKHVGIVMLYESMICALISIIGGIILGLVFGKMFFLLLMKVTRIAEGSKFIINSSVFIKTFIFFMVVYLVTLLWNQIQVRLSKPIELLKGEEIGQKEKRSTVLLAIIGLGLLGAGYYLAITIENAMAAISVFFVAVLLVIGGTYYTFRAGSIVVLKLLKKNKKYYYKTNHFITVSGMIHRMKQNATGLSNICILSTMVLVTLSTTIALYVGQEKTIAERNPTDYVISMDEGSADSNKLKDVVYEVAKTHNITVKNYTDISIKDTIVDYNNGTIKAVDDKSLFGAEYRYDVVTFVPLEEYNRLTGKSEELKDNEMLMSLNNRKSNDETVKLVDKTYEVKGSCDDLNIKNSVDAGAQDNIYIVIDKKEDILDCMKKLSNGYSTGNRKKMNYTVYFDVEGKTDDRIACANDLKEVTYNLVNGRSFSNIDIDREESYKLFGGLVFLGFFLGIVFLLAMVMIIYFKQISEGFEDRKRYEILNKVGLDKKDVKKTINKQIVQVFFLPLIGSIVHVAFAFKMITKMLLIFNLTDKSLILGCTLLTIAIFTVIYVLVFKLTAKAYYRIVNR